MAFDALQAIGLAAVLEDKAFQDGLSRYDKGVNQMESLTDKGASAMTKVWAVGSAAVTIGAAAVVAGIAGIAAISKTGIDALVSWNNEVNTLSDNLGTTGEQSSAWAVAFAHVGLSVEEGGAGLNFLVKSLDGYKKAVAAGKGDTSEFGTALKTLGVSAFDAHGKLRTFDDLMPDLLDAFQKLPPGVDKSALAMQLFGARAGTKFLDFLSQGSAGLEEARAKAKLYGLELTTDLSNAVEDFTFALNDTNLGLKGFWVQIGSKVLPVVNKFVVFFNAKLLPPLVRFAQFVAPILASALDNVFNIFQDFFLLIAGENKLPQLAKNIGDLAAMFGLSGQAVTDFILKVAGLIQKVVPVVQDVIGVFRDLFVELGQGNFTDAISDFVSGLLEITGVTDEIANKIGSFVGDLAGEIQKGDWGGFAQTLITGLQTAWQTVLPTLNAWGTEIWGWITAVAIPALAGAGAKLIAGIVQFVVANGPGTWGLVTEWGGKFWDWLTGPGGALEQVGAKVFEIASSLASWLDTNWKSTLAPALGQWATDFWGWVTGAIALLPQAMVDLSAAFVLWTKSPAAEKMFNDVGFAIGKGIMDAIGAFFAGGEGAGGAVEIFVKMQHALEQAQLNMAIGFFNIGKSIGAKIGEGIAASDFSKSLYDALNKAADALFGKLNEIADKIVKAIVEAFSHFTITLPELKLPTITLPGVNVPPVGGGTPPPTASGQMLPIALMVQIDGAEIKNAVLTYATGQVQSIFGDAIQQVGA